MPHAPALADVLVILLSAVLVVPLFERLKASPVLGYLAAGMLIGPHGLAIIGDPDGAAMLAHFGVVFLLFAIGLELSLERLRVMRTWVFGLGTLQVAATTAVGWLGAKALGLSNAAALVAAGGLALSSTAIVMQILKERDELGAKHGRVAFAVLLMQDLAVVPLLTLVPLLGSYQSDVAWALGLAAVKAVAALVGIVVVGQVVLRPVLRMVAAARSPELFTGVTLLIVLGVGWLTDLAGLSMALGAFLAGLVIAETEYCHQVEADIEPFRGVLLALFFMTVGMTVDLGLVAKAFPVVLVLAVALVAGKALLLGGLARLFGISAATAVQVGLTLSQGGEFAFVLYDLARGHGVLAPEEAQLMLAVIALSMAATPFLMAAGRRLAGRLAQPPSEALRQMAGATGELRGHVLIAGFGRVGQTLARVLEANEVPWVAVDLEPRRVGEGRARGLPVYFGDACRPDVLAAAGAGHARAAVVTLDHPALAERAVRALRGGNPAMTIVVRGHDGGHADALERAGATFVVPEAVEASLELGGTVLRGLGQDAYDVERVLHRFREDAYASLGNLIPAKPPPRRHPVAVPISLDDLNDPRR
ncbi:monovalent cation:proton antiporter-2 (CPA2) family protein [Azospirillum sp. TSO22-1]|uniref:monovalent cation:proton antiporter-2 (CPA2) family protein n=1 Tax=Azospirillum sp. TSO22-1 TaxID=716789 RepID=UPI000D6594DB|nr:monovalent cation:proton antiporter-2 (CPA2) family protein [Azospirillum sp. TSO22-1]